MRTKEEYYGKAILAAFIASVVVALIYLTKQTFAPAHDTDYIYWLSAAFGRPDQMAIGWMAHFVIGSIFGGVIFAWLSPHLSGKLIIRGLVFGALCWLALMIVIMPMTEAGLFGQNLSGDMMLPVCFLFLKLTYGAVLGFIYGELLQEQSLPESERLGSKNEDRRPPS